jgi:hypothetical protein
VAVWFQDDSSYGMLGMICPTGKSCDHFFDAGSFCRPGNIKNDFNVKCNLLKRFNVIRGVQMARQKYSDFQKLQIGLYS